MRVEGVGVTLMVRFQGFKSRSGITVWSTSCSGRGRRINKHALTHPDITRERERQREKERRSKMHRRTHIVRKRRPLSKQRYTHTHTDKEIGGEDGQRRQRRTHSAMIRTTHPACQRSNGRSTRVKRSQTTQRTPHLPAPGQIPGLDARHHPRREISRSGSRGSTDHSVDIASNL